MLKIERNPDEEIYKEVTQSVKDNGGYCPCIIEKSKDTLCPCKDFRNQLTEGECHCGRFIKIDTYKK